MQKQASAKVTRPWGTYQIIFRESNVWVKRVEIDPGARISLQKHNHRSEKWIIVSGDGLVVVNNATVIVTASSVVDIPVKVLHRIANVGKAPLVFIEVACGRKLTEEDIIRIHDDFDRILGAGGTVKKISRKKL
jgi:mannose-6-phosphate isomerase-like protein (cupin superfamily)